MAISHWLMSLALVCTYVLDSYESLLNGRFLRCLPHHVTTKKNSKQLKGSAVTLSCWVLSI